jgi:hypothetical protein
MQKLRILGWRKRKRKRKRKEINMGMCLVVSLSLASFSTLQVKAAATWALFPPRKLETRAYLSVPYQHVCACPNK